MEDLSSFPSTASTSQEDHENNSGSTSSRKLRVTFLSSEWSSTKGGLSTINRELAIQLAKRPSVEVCVYLPQCSEEDKRVAASHNVRLIKAEEMPGLEPNLWLSCLPENHAVDCVIGHGAALGRQVQLIKRQHKCKWIQIVHTAPEELGMYKSYADAISKGEKKHQAEIKLCEKADQVVAVGSKLAETFSGYLRACGKDQDVLNLTPGIFSEFAGVKQAAEERKAFSVLVFGRGDNEDFQLKGYDIAARAIAELKDESQPYKLLFVGAPRGEEEKVKDLLLQQGIDQRQLTVRCFPESREQLARLFSEVDLAIMPSRTEGFGLAALEALSAGLPVLVSGNTGLREALKNVLYGSSCVVESDDPKVWAKAIKAVRQTDKKTRLHQIKTVRKSYALKYNWEKECDKLVERMSNITLGGFHATEPEPFFFQREKLKDDRTVSDYNILNKSTVNLSLQKYRLEVTILSEGRRSVTLEVNATDSILELKREIQDMTDVPPKMQSLSFAGKELENEKTIFEYKIQNKSSINLVVKIKVYLVNRLTQESMTLVQKPRDTIESVKNTIYAQTNISLDRQVLTFNGEELYDGHSLKHYKIESESQLFLDEAVEIIVEMPNETAVRLKLFKSNTIEEVNVRLCSLRYLRQDIPWEMPRLCLRDKPLRHSDTLSDLNIQNNSVLRCVDVIRIHIKMPNENQIRVDVNLDDNIRKVKEEIQDGGGIPLNQPCLLMYKGEQLNNSYTLRHYNLRNGSILSLVKSEELREAFLHWIQIRRHTKEELEHLERNLKLAKPSITTRTVVRAAMGGAAFGATIAPPFTFGASLMVSAAGAGIGALIASYLGAEEEKKFRLSEVQVAIEKDRKACVRLQELLGSLNGTFSSTTSAGATPGAIVRCVSGASEHLAWRFADPSVLPRDITQLVKSSLDRHLGSTSPIVAEIRDILYNLKCPDEAEIKYLVPEDEILDW